MCSMLPGVGMIRLKSSDSTSTSLSGYQNSTTSEDIPDPDSVSVCHLGNLALLASRRWSLSSAATTTTNSEEPTSTSDVVMPFSQTPAMPVPRCRRRRPSNFLELPNPQFSRPRVCSMPETPYNPRESGDIYRLRSFSITSKGIVNRGDALISKRCRSNASICSTTSSGRTGSWCTSPCSPHITSPTSFSLPDAAAATAAAVASAAANGPAVTPSTPHSHSRVGFSGSVEDLQADNAKSDDVDWFAPHILRSIRKGSSPGPRYDRRMYLEEFATRNSQATRRERRSLQDCVQYRGGLPYADSNCRSPSISSQTTGLSDTSLDVPVYRVALLGHGGVGKTSLVNQLLTSDYINTYDASLDEEFGEKSVLVLLDNQESEVVFIDHPAHEMSVENMLSTYDPHVCVVVYSVTHMESFRIAEDILHYLWQENATREKAIILCANKVDLARSRIVKTEAGKSLAISHESKYIETSSGIQHNIDELLVGIVKQVRLRLKAKQKRMRKMSSSKTSLSLHTAKELLSKMCLIDNKSKSCDNLHVL